MLESDSQRVEALLIGLARPPSMRPTKKPPVPAKRPRRLRKPTVAIIGGGRLGTALGIALRRAGYSIGLVASKGTASARKSARLFGGATHAFAVNHLKSEAAALTKNSLLIIATPDDAIATVANELAAMLPQGFPHAKPRRGSGIALHTSGALFSEVLKPLRAKGFATASFHPLVSISDSKVGAQWLKRAYFALEGDAAAIRVAKRIVRDLGGRSFTIKADRKALYHAAALMASPNMTALFDIALEMLTRCGLPPRQAQAVLLPLVRSTLENLSTQAPSAALTGTFKRGDVATVRKHLAAIQNQDLDDALRAYVLLGERSLSLAKLAEAGKQIQTLLTRTLKESRR